MRRIQSFLRHPAIPALVVLMVSGGCTLFRAKGPERFRVEGSSLDSLDIRYNPDPENSRFQIPARLTIFGSGQIRLRSGLSPQVMDSFASDPTHPHWNHYYEDNAGFRPEEIRDLFQRLVDAGMVYSNITGPKRQEALELPNLQMAGKINGHKIVRFTDDPEIVGIVENLLNWFAR